MPGSQLTSHLAPRTAWKFRAIGVTSIFVGLLTALLCEKVLVAERQETAQIKQDQLQRGPAYENEFQGRQTACVIISAMSDIELGVSAMLLLAAILLLRPHFLGVVLHRIYAFVQLLACVVMSAILMSLLSATPAGMMFYLGAIPGLILSIFPIGVLIMLRGVSNSRDC